MNVGEDVHIPYNRLDSADQYDASVVCPTASVTDAASPSSTAVPELELVRQSVATRSRTRRRKGELSFTYGPAILPRVGCVMQKYGTRRERRAAMVWNGFHATGQDIQ